MAGFGTSRTKSPETKKERYQPTFKPSDQIDDSWTMLDSSSRSKVDEIADSTLEPPDSYENESFVADEGENIKSDGDIHSSTDSSNSSVSSGSISVSISSAASPPRQQDQQQQESTSSSSSFWDSSSSESTSVSSQPQHQRLGDLKAAGSSENSNSKHNEYHAGEKETGSAKLRRILYGSSSSSFADEYTPLSSSNSYSAELKYEKSNNERDSNSRNRDKKSLGAVVEAGDKNNRASVDERGENVKETLNVMSFPKNKERNGVPFSPSSGNGNLNKINEEITKYGDSFSSQGRVENDDKFEGKNSNRSNESSEIQSKQSQSRRENHEINKVSTHNEGVRAVSTTSPNFSLDSRSRSSTKPKPSISNNSRSYIGARARKGKTDSKEPNGDETAQRTANSAMLMARSSEIPEDPPSFDSTDVNSSTKSGNDVEQKESTIWARTEEFKKMNYGVNDMTIDELGWKPPALTTFCPSNYDKSTKQHRKKKDPKERESAFGSKQGSRTTPIDKKTTKNEKKIDKNELPPPISEIIVRQPSDDDSTLGTEGTYLERFPKKKKNKNKEKPTVNGVVPNSSASKTPKPVVVNDTPADRKSGGTEKYDTTVPITPAEYIPNHSTVPITPAGYIPNHTTVPITPAEYIPKLPRIVQKNFPDEPKSSLQPRPEIASLGNNDYKVPVYVVSGTRRGFENHMSGRADPPGDTYLFPYDPRNSQQQQSQFGSSDYTRPDNVDHVDKNFISPEPTASVGDSITPGDETPQHILLSPMPVTSWVTPSMKGRGGELDHDPTRIFINSILTKKRSIPPPQSMIDDRHLQQKPKTRQQSQISVGLGREKASGRTGSEYSMSQSRDIGTTNISESTSKNISELREMPRSECSTSQSQKFASLMKIHGEISRKIGGEISRTKYPQNAPQSQPFAIIDASFNSKTKTNSYDMKHAKRTSILQHNKPREIQYGSNDEGDYMSDDSESSSSSPSSSALAERFPTRDDRSSSRRRSGKTVMFLLWFLAVLIIAGAIVVAVLWQLGILFNNVDDDSQPTPIAFPTPKPLPPVTLSPVTPRTKAPSVAPTKIESSTNLFNLIIEAYPQGQLALEDPNSPQAKALKWLESSTNSGISEVQSFLQRYALATVYYSTNGDDWIDNTGWLSERDECNWMSTAASICDELGKYAKLDLQENNLVGTLPAELGILSDTLRSINTRTNYLSGEIPSPMISDLAKLEVLDLSSNSFSGVLTKQLFDATSLTRLSLFENNLSSSIPTELGQLTKLNVLDLGSNKLTSTIPPTIEKLSKLAGLSLFNNMLTGSVPTELSAIQSLKVLYIDSNNLGGPLPTEVCLLNIEEFWGDCEEIQCTCCTTCCSNNFGCFVV
jgi:hypothetical protein